MNELLEFKIGDTRYTAEGRILQTFHRGIKRAIHYPTGTEIAVGLQTALLYCVNQGSESKWWIVRTDEDGRPLERKRLTQIEAKQSLFKVIISLTFDELQRVCLIGRGSLYLMESIPNKKQYRHSSRAGKRERCLYRHPAEKLDENGQANGPMRSIVLYYNTKWEQHYAKCS